MSKESVSPAGSSPAYLLLCLVSVNSGGVSQLCVPTQPGAIGHTIAGPGAGASARQYRELSFMVTIIVNAKPGQIILYLLLLNRIERKDIIFSVPDAPCVVGPARLQSHLCAVSRYKTAVAGPGPHSRSPCTRW